MSVTGNDFDSFGTLLHASRKQAKLTQHQLALAVGMNRHEISRWEQGAVLPGSKSIVLELARHLHLSDQQARQLLEASLTAPKPLWGVPFPRNHLFTGREHLLETMHSSLSVKQGVVSAPFYVLQGLGGIGKTQTALEYAYRHALEYRAVCWVEAENLEQALLSFRRIAELLRLAEQETTEAQQVLEAVQYWFSTHDQWLLIWDNLEDLELPYRLLPLVPRGSFLATTRRQALGILARGSVLVPMQQEEGMLLFLRRAKLLEPEATPQQMQHLATRMPTEYEAAVELVTALGGLPLALDQAGAYLEETGCRPSDYLHRYTLQRALLLDRRGSLGSGHPQSVATTFKLSQERVEYEQQEVADLLRVCAFLHAEAIPEDLFHGVAHYLGPTLASIDDDPVQLDLMLAALRNLSLIQRQAETRTFSLHRLLQVVVREQMDPTEERLWGERVIRFMNALFPAGDYLFWAQSERYLAQALACVPLIAAWGQDLPEAGALLSRVGRYMLGHRRLEEAERLLGQAVILGERQCGQDHPVLIPRLTDMIELLWRQGKYECAVALSSRLLAIEKQHLEPTHARIGETLNNLATIYADQGNYEQAELLFQQALHIREQSLGPEHPDVALSLSHLAALYGEQGEYEKAEGFFRRALSLQERSIGLKHPDAALTLHGLATLCQEQGNYAQAEALYQQALSIRQRVLGSEHPDVVKSLHSLAQLYEEQGQFESAEALHQQVLSVQKSRSCS